MTHIGSLLDSDTRARMAQIVADVQDEAPAFVIIKASTDPNPPRTLTQRDALDIDPASEAMIDAACVDCGVPMLIDPKVPEGVDPEAPRVPICAKDAKIRARYATITEQRNVEAIHRKSVARHQPRITDNIDHPVVTTTKENPMYDLDNLSDAELGATVRQDMAAKAAEALPEKRKKAKKAKAKQEVKATKQVKERQAERRQQVYAAFMVGDTLVVPALDLTGVEDLNEEPPATQRSAYNKARFRLAGERPLWAPKDEDEDDYEPTTYQTLIFEHARLMALAEVKATEKSEKAQAKAAKKSKAPKIVALLDDEQEADVRKKAKALAKLTGISKDEARRIVMNG